MLNERQKLILKEVVDNYIQFAEPVGSKLIADNANGKVSSATIRNEMSFLESEGYLEKPHISAGRVPTDRGYREYVDNLMSISDLEEAEREIIREELSLCVYENGDLFKSASEVLSQKTGYLSLTLTPKSKTSYIKQLRILSIEPGRALVVVVMSAGMVHDRIIRISDLFSAADLDRIARDLQYKVQGVDLQSITLITLQELESSLNVDEAIINQLIFEVFVTIKQADEMDIYIDGIQNLNLQPEFQYGSEMTKVYNALNKDGLLLANISNGLNDTDEQLLVRIGREIEISDLDNCSLVSTTYKLADNLYGVISVIGPKRMNYKNVIPKITFVRESINSIYNNGRLID